MSNIFKSMKMDLELKGYSPKTVDAYVRYAKKFIQHYQKPIEQLRTDEIRNYLHYLIVNKNIDFLKINKVLKLHSINSVSFNILYLKFSFLY